MDLIFIYRDVFIVCGITPSELYVMVPPCATCLTPHVFSFAAKQMESWTSSRQFANELQKIFSSQIGTFNLIPPLSLSSLGKNLSTSGAFSNQKATSCLQVMKSMWRLSLCKLHNRWLLRNCGMEDGVLVRPICAADERTNAIRATDPQTAPNGIQLIFPFRTCHGEAPALALTLSLISWLPVLFCMVSWSANI